jgi:hypothetical protein
MREWLPEGRLAYFISDGSHAAELQFGMRGLRHVHAE